jgi:hypothetical protein
MNGIFLVSYRVKGIKNFEEEVSLSFYKKTITKPIDTGNYNVKGIYGMNGSGKSAIISSVDILRNFLINENYLNNPIVQSSLDEIINKKIEELHIGTRFLFEVIEDMAYLYEYEVVLKKNNFGKYVIDSEQLSYKNAFSKKDEFIPVFKVKKGEIEYINTEEGIDSENEFREKTKNLLSNSSASSLFIMKFHYNKIKTFNPDSISIGIRVLIGYSFTVQVYMDQSDNHTDYFVNDILNKNSEKDIKIHTELMNVLHIVDIQKLGIFSCKTDTIPVDKYESYKDSVKKLKKFIQIFKPELKDIEIERKDKGDNYVCSLNMVYEGFSINSEFESTGIKKLIKLYAYLQEMVQGGIVFIDELDSNLHDVYLCALLEYLMNYGQGQLCFTTHNVGPMDILKRNKKSIDFLSIDNKIYPWKTNGNYSPAKLYRNGMIEGSPFNIDAIDFIDVFDTPEG